MTDEPIAIIGLAGLFPQAKTLEDYWHNIVAGKDCIEIVPESRWKIAESYDPDPQAVGKTYCRHGGFIPSIDFDPVEYGIPPQQLEQIDCAQLLALAVAKAALLDAGYGPHGEYNHQQTGVILGAAGTTMQLLTSLLGHSQAPTLQHILQECHIPPADITRLVKHYQNNLIDWKEMAFPGVLANVIAGRISNRFDLGGINCTIDAACASSLAAINLAILELQSKQCDLVITGGIDANNRLETYICFSKTPVLTKGEAVQSFDADADGTLVSEGLGMLVLKRLADAERDQDRIYAVIRGIGVSSDGRSKSIFAPDKAGQMQALKMAYQSANLNPQAIGLIEAHSPGTRAGDDVELAALTTVFQAAGVAYQQTALGSVKSQIGHTKAAAGAASLIKTTLALYQKVLPPTLHVKNPNPALLHTEAPFYINQRARPWVQAGHGKRSAGVSSFGFGGANYHILVEEHASQGVQDEFRFNVSHWPIFLTAENKHQLISQCTQLIAQLKTVSAEEIWWSLLQESHAIILPATAPRLGFLTTTWQDTLEKLQQILTYFEHNFEQTTWHHPAGIWFHETALAGEVVAVFTGQGSQYREMGSEFGLYHPEYRHLLQAMDEYFIRDELVPLSQIVFPRDFSEENTSLNSTHYTQTSIGVLSAAFYQYFKRLGLVVDRCVGHSFGELTALWAAEALTTDGYLSLIYQRGKLFSTLQGLESVMLAVQAEATFIEAYLLPNLYIANLNSPLQTVVVGSQETIAEFQQLLAEYQIKSQIIPVTTPFHTPLLNALDGGWKEVIKKALLSTPALPVYSNTSGQVHSHQATAIKTLLYQHPFTTVQFQKNIEKSYQAGGRIYIEFGPRGVLTKLVQQTLQDVPHIALALNPSRDRNSEIQLREAMLQLRLAGVKFNGFQYDQLPAKPITKNDHTISLTAINYISPSTLAKRKAQSVQAMSAIDPLLWDKVQQIQEKILTLHDNFIKLNAEHQQQLQAHLQSTKNYSQLSAQIQTIQEQQQRVALVHENFLQQQQQSLNKLLQALYPETGGQTFAPVIASLPILPHVLHHSVEPELPTAIPAPVPALNIQQQVLAVVSEKTGYPVNVLDVNMELEADLGIDSIKRVEIFAALNIKNSSNDNGLNAVPLRTLQQVIHFLQPQQAVITTPDSIPALPVTIATYSYGLKAITAAVPLDFALAKQKSILIVAEQTDFSLAIKSRLQQQWPQASVKLLSLAGQNEDNIKSLFQRFCATYQAPSICIYIPVSQDRTALETGLLLAKYAKQDLVQESWRHCFMIVTRGDGQFGLSQPAAMDYYQAGLAGLVKTLHCEWPAVHCRFLDIATHYSPEEVSYLVNNELLDVNSQIVEIAYCHNSRFTPTLYTLEMPNELTTEINQDSVFIVTGGGTGITAECIKAMAAQYQCHFILLGRSEYQDDPTWAQQIADEKSLKQAASAYFLERQEALKPQQIAALVQTVLRSRSIRTTLAAIEQVGGKASYQTLDITNLAACQQYKAELRRDGICGIIHGAGVLTDKYIENKTTSDLTAVLAPKIEGLHNLLTVVEPEHLQYLILFSSTAATFGNEGQADYAVANEVLNKFVHYYQQQYPTMQCMAINWGPWDSGMVSEELRQRFLQRGISVLPTAMGTAIFLQAMTAAKQYNQIIVGSSLALPTVPLQKMTVKKLLTIHNCPFLLGHLIREKPVLPMAWIMTWVTDVCAQLFPHYLFAKISNLQLLRGIVFAPAVCSTYYLTASVVTVLADELQISIDIYSEKADGQLSYHYKGTVLLSSYQLSPALTNRVEALPIALSSTYIDLLYGGELLRYGKEFQGVKAIVALTPEQIVTHCILPELNADTVGNFSAINLNPYAYDIATHAVLIWLVHFHQALCLPAVIGSYQQFAVVPSGEPIYVTLSIKQFSMEKNHIIFALVGQDADGQVYFQGDDIKMTVISLREAKQSLTKQKTSTLIE
jgi:acyl transferase domain-containing protein